MCVAEVLGMYVPVVWLVSWFYGMSTILGLFNAKGIF